MAAAACRCARGVSAVALAGCVSPQLAGAAVAADRAAAGDRRRGWAHRGRAARHAHRRGWCRQDTVGLGGGRRGGGCVSGWHLVRGARARRRSRRRGSSDTEGHRCDGDTRRLTGGSCGGGARRRRAGVGDPGQLRAPRGGVRGLRVHGAATQPGGDRARDEPRAARRDRRDRVAGAVAVVASYRRATGRRGDVPVRRRQPVRRPGSTGPTLVRGERRQRARHCADLPSSRRHPVGGGTGGGPVPPPEHRADRGRARRSVPLADRRTPRGVAPAADARRLRRVELRPPRRCGAPCLTPAGGVRRGVLARSSRSHCLGAGRSEPDHGLRHDQSPRRQELGAGRRVR